MQTAPRMETEPACCGSDLRFLGLAVVIHALGLAGLLTAWLVCPAQSGGMAVTRRLEPRAPSSGQAAVVQLASAEGALRVVPESTPGVDPRVALMQGVWRDYYRGERTLTLNPDGTGEMVVVLAGFAKKMFAERLSFEVEWNLTGDQLVMETRSGKPESKFQLIRKLYGDRAEYDLLALESGLMRWRDAGGKTEYEWSRWTSEAP